MAGVEGQGDAAAEGGVAVEQQPQEDEEEEWVLREVVTSLGPFLGHLGLKPSRVVSFMPGIGAPDLADQFPTVDMRRSIVQHERQDVTGQTAALAFVDMLLDPGSPANVLSDFMEALFAANHDSQYRHPNPGAWRVHDVLRLCCAYHPLLRAVQRQLGHQHSASQQHSPPAPHQQRQQHEHQDQPQEQSDVTIDVRGVVNRLRDQRHLAPELCPQVLETAQLDDAQAALTCLLACVCATCVDTLKVQFEDEISPGVLAEGGGGSAPAGDAAPSWILRVVEAIEEHGAAGFSDLVPEDVFSAHTWGRVYDRLAYGRRGRTPNEEDTQSESGETVRPHDDDGPAPARSREGELLGNRDQDFRRQWTRACVYGSGVTGEEIPHIMEIITYEFQRMRAEEPPPAPPPSQLTPISDDLDDRASVGAQSSEANSQVPDTSSSSSVRLSLMRDISGSTRLTREGYIELLHYQEEVLTWARQGCNVAIFLPTGTGKTFVVLRYMQEHLASVGGAGRVREQRRVVFLAPKVKLAEQQYHRFCEFFPHATYFRCGRYRSSNAPFSELLDTYKVYVMTPQCLVEAMERKEVQITDFSLLVLDECHHVARGRHSFRLLMEAYMNVKYSSSESSVRRNARLPQVIGLTASPGVGVEGSLAGAAKHVRQLCYVMDVDRVSTVQRHQEELRNFVSQPKHQIHTCGGRKKDGFRNIIVELMEKIEQTMLQCVDSERLLTEQQQKDLRGVLAAPTLHRGRPMYLHWACNLQDKLADYTDFPNTYRSIFSMAEMLVMCQRVVTVNEDSDSMYALELLQSQLTVLEDQVPRHSLRLGLSQERRLMDLFNFRIPELQAACEDEEDYNPKLKMLEEILLALMDKNQDDVACMVFVRSLELTRAIQSWLQRHPQLKGLNPGRITGLRKSVHEGGLSRQEISDVVTNFNVGQHRLVVCTSAAEEGLDFQACNLVVRYDYVTSMISMIQIRGRARRMDSQYCLLGSLSPANVHKEQENLAWERLMTQAIQQVQQDMDGNPNGFQEAMALWQRTDLQARLMQQRMVLEKERKRIQDTAVYRLLCRKCQGFVCMSTDFRLVCQSNRAVVARGFETRWKRVDKGAGKQMKQNLEKVAKVHCGAPHCAYDWGILARYIPTGRLLPVLKIESFFLVNAATGEQLKQKLKWSQAPFHVPDISEEELA